MAARPSGAAMTVSGPFRMTTAPDSSRGCTRTIELGAGKIAEHAAELALVRRQHHRALRLLLDLREQVGDDRLGIVVLIDGEGGQCVGVEHTGGVVLEHDLGEEPRRDGDAGCRADQHGVAPLVGQYPGQAARALERLDHDRGQMRGIDGDGIGRARHSDEAGADLSAPRAPSRAAPVRCAGPETTTA